MGAGRSSGEGNGNPLQYSCLKNPMERGAWQATVQRVAKSWTQLSMHHQESENIFFLGFELYSYYKGFHKYNLHHLKGLPLSGG